MIKQNRITLLSLALGIASLVGSAVLYILAIVVSSGEPFIELEFDTRISFYLKLAAITMLLTGSAITAGSILLRKSFKSGKFLIIAGASYIVIFPLWAIWQTHKAFGISPILILLIVGWGMITAIFAIFIYKLKRI